MKIFKSVWLVLTLSVVLLACKGTSGSSGGVATGSKGTQTVDGQNVSVPSPESNQTTQPSGPTVVPIKDLQKTSIKKDVPASK
jgi:hypothetical protein